MATGYNIIGAPAALPDLGVIVRCVVERVLGMLATGIFGVWITPGVCVFLHVNDSSLVSIIGASIGSVAWLVTPKTIDLLQRVFLAKVEKAAKP